MKELLTDVVYTLEKLNKYVDHGIVDTNSLSEEYDNLNNFQELYDCIKTELKALDQASSFNRNETKEILLELHTKIMNYYWHIDQPKIMIEKFIGKYRDCIDKKALADDQ